MRNTVSTGNKQKIDWKKYKDAQELISISKCSLCLITTLIDIKWLEDFRLEDKEIFQSELLHILIIL